MSSSTDSIEVTASTIDEAISQALERLQAEQDGVTIEVLSTPRAGLLGLGVRQARVRVTRRSPEAATSGVTSPPPAPPPKPRSTAVPQAPARTVRPAVPERQQGRAAAAAPPRQSPLPPSEHPMDRPMPFEEEERVEELTDQAAPKEAPARSGRPEVPERQQSREAASSRQNPRPPAERPRDRPSMPFEVEERIEELTEQSDESQAPDTDDRRVIDTRAQVAEGAEVLGQILELMGEKATIETVCDDDPEMLELNIKGDGSGLLIGRHGQTLDALEYLINRILARRIHEATPISIDTESYRARRRGQLHRMALSKGEEAKREHQAVTLEPMPPRDRRIVHLALKDDPLVTTRSAGDGFLRAVQIVPIDNRRDGGGNSGSRDRRSRGGPRGRDHSSAAEQGGFQHGQKRIV